MTRTSPQVPRSSNVAKKPSGRRALPGIVSSIIRPSQPVTTEVYDTYWKFAFERQEVYFRRLQGQNAPWTADPIIQMHRFTNAYRAADRVSQYLIQEVICSSESSDLKDIFFRILVFKFFNRIDTWELLEHSLGRISWSTYAFDEYDRVLTRAIDSGRRIYSAAYIMPACSSLAEGRKHRGHLRLIEKMVREGVAERLNSAKEMAKAFAILKGFPMMGDFLAFQYIIDLNYSGLTNFSESEFVVPGPGARDGIRKVFSEPGGYSEPDLIRWMVDKQEQEFDRLALPFRSLFGRRLQLIDCQNLFCEVDKYSRIFHPNILGLSGRTRIKQRYEIGERPNRPFFPLKWGLSLQIDLPPSTFSEPTYSPCLFHGTA